jgi:hypothetical protein
VLKAVAGVQNLKTIVATASSARILNLHGLWVDPPKDPDYFGKPLFAHPVLNRAIIIKHNARPGEESRLAPRRFNATKVIFPFDPLDLNLGGQYVFVGQPHFTAALTRRLEYGGLSPERDVSVLGILDGLPTLDPFLVREALHRHRLDVAEVYYRFSEPDQADMLGFVEREIESLIELCFGKVQAHDRRAQKLAQMLLSDHEGPELAPLQQTLRLDGPQFAEAMFAWKAILYYRWRARGLAPGLKVAMRSIGRISRRRYGTDDLRFVLAAKELLESMIARTWREISDRLRLYDHAYEALTQAGNPESFRGFLVNGSKLFLELGERIGRLEQLVDFWDYRLGQHHTGAMSPEEVMDAMRDLLQGLAIWPAATPPPAETLAPAPQRRAVAAG